MTVELSLLLTCCLDCIFFWLQRIAWIACIYVYYAACEGARVHTIPADFKNQGRGDLCINLINSAEN